MHYRNDKVTTSQLKQVHDLTGSSLFTDAERAMWRFEVASEDRFGARDMIARLSEEWKRRDRAQREAA
jgi:hypothetical protein